MAKRLVAKIDEYQKDGQTKGKYVTIGVILSNDNGEYALIDPTVDLSGVLIKQRILNPQKAGASVICSIFDDANNSNQQGNQNSQQSSNPNDFYDDDIGF